MQEGCRLAILCGDSIATTFGITSDAESRAYPEVAKSRLEPTGWTVQTMILGGAMVTVTLSRIDEVTRQHPSVVVLAHGTREAMLMYPRVLRRFRVHPDGEENTTADGQVVRSLKWLRLAAARSYLRVAGQPWGDHISELLRIRPFMAPSKFDHDLDLLISTLLKETDSQIVLLLPVFARMTNYPWSPRALASNRAALSRWASRAGRRVTVVDPHGVLAASDFSRDGAHLSASGHETMARLVSTAIQRCVDGRESQSAQDPE